MTKDKIKVLYIDDNPGDRALVMDSLEKEHEGISLTLAKSKQEFEQLITENVFDLVLTDFNIAGFEGLQVLGTVKSLSPDTPVIIVTGTGSEEVAVEALKQGAADYIIKSIQHIARLPNTINTVLEKERIEEEQKKDRKKLIKLNRVYALISQINQLIVRIRDKDQLFRNSCDIAIEHGKFQMAWIGLADETSELIRPYCWSGREEGYLSKITIKTSKDSPEGKGPTGTAFREGKYLVCNDIEHDPIMEPWRNEALKRDYCSSIALPIKLENKIIGIFTLYTREPGFFDDQEIRSLKEAASDISYALDTIKADEIRRKTEEELVKMNRVFAVVSQINQLIVRIQDRDKLFRGACDIAIKFGKFRMAWIGLIDEGFKIIAPYCWSGYEEGYLSKIKIISTENLHRGKGPTGKAFRTGNSVVCNDIENNPDFKPWRNEALKRGYHSSIGLPIKLDQKVIGTFNIYAHEPEFFDAREIKMLREVVADLSFALDTFQVEQERNKIEKELKESEDRYRDLFENSNDLVCLHDLDGKLLMVNAASAEITGYSQDELLNMNLHDLILPEYKPLFDGYLSEIEKKGRAEGIMSILTKTGENRFWVFNNSLRTKGVEKPMVRGIVRDITGQRIAESKLRAQKDELQKFFDEDISGDIIIEPSGKILKCNKTFLKMFGFNSEKEALQYPAGKLFLSPTTRKSFIELVKKNKKREFLENEYVTLDGRHISVLENAIGIFNNEGELIKIRSYIVDITPRVKAIAEIRKLSRAIEQSPETIIITDKGGKIEYVDPTFTNVTGYTLDEVVGQTPKILSTHEKSKDEYKMLWDTIISGNIWRGEFHNKKKNGELYWEQASISPIINEKGEITHFVAVKEDITERKAKDIELKMALEKAQESDRLKSAFLANMSHEIRTPMNGIIGFAELLKEPMLSGKTQQEYIRIIEKSADRMLNIITDIINISKIEAGQMDVHVSNASINEEIDFLYSFFGSEIDQKGLKLSCHKPLSDAASVIKTDPEKVFGAMTNLIKNAIKFTSEGSIEFGYEKKGDFLEFFVKDTGIGIADKNKDIVFERFRQGSESLTRNYEGAGLGLSISKAYVELLGGKMWFESRCGTMPGEHGTDFYFTIPYPPLLTKRVENKDAKSVTSEKSHEKKLKILIAEDDEVSEILLKYILEPFVKEILNVFNGEEAVETCKQNPDIDMVLMDIRMPQMNGYDATLQIRKFNKDVVIIAQTAFAMEGDREKALEAGCNDYISKPIQLDEFKVILKKYNLD